MRLKKEIIIWRFLDGKIGHEKESLALVNSLKLKISIFLTINLSYSISVYLVPEYEHL